MLGADAGRAPGRVRVQPTDRDRRLFALGVRHGRFVPSQAWRWEWPSSASIRPVWNRLGQLERGGWLERLPTGLGEGVYVPTATAARLVRHLTGGLSEPKVPDTGERRWYSNLTHDLTIPEAERWLLAEATPGSRFLTVRELFRERALTLPVAQRRGGAGMGYRPDGVLVLPDGRRVAIEVELHDKAERLAEPDGKLRDYRVAHEHGEYAEVLWLVPDAAVSAPLLRAIDATGCDGFMAVELLAGPCRLHLAGQSARARRRVHPAA